jgi:hypothetical protein
LASLNQNEGSEQFPQKRATREVKRQVEHALVVTARKIGKMAYDKLERDVHNDMCVAIVGVGLADRQFYQL